MGRPSACGGLLALFATACSSDDRNDPHQFPMPEVPVVSFEEQLASQKTCEASLILVNSGPVELNQLKFQIKYFDRNYRGENELWTAAGTTIAELPRGKRMDLRLPYECNDAIGLRKLRAYWRGLPIRVVGPPEGDGTMM